MGVPDLSKYQKGDPHNTPGRSSRPLECGRPIGRVYVKNLKGREEFVGFYCNKPQRHLDACEFVGTEVLIRSRQQ